MCRETAPGSRFKVSCQAGFSLITAIFLVVVLALLGTLIVSVTGLQQSSTQLDLLGVRAYHAARAGMEWGAYQVLDPNDDIVGCGLASCPVSPTDLPPLAGSLSGFAVTVTCTQVADTTEGNRNVRMFQIVSTACNQGGSCPNATPTDGYVERRVQALLSKCKDPTAAAPRCACG
jgi:MSHA biogenesis protein MshP